MEVDSRFFLGLGLSFLNCVLSSIGFTLQRKSQLLSESDHAPDVQRRSWVLWAVGVSLYISAAAPDVLAYTLVPQVVCVTVACFRLVVVTILAHIFLEERLQRREAVGMVACSLGTFLCLIYGPRIAELGAEMPAADFYHPQVWSYLGVCLLLLLLLLVVEHMECFKANNGLHYVTLPLATGLAFAMEKVFNTEIGFVRPPNTLSGIFREPLWLCMVASIGALGATDFYLNLRAAAKMPVQVFLPVSFTLATALQFFQSIAIFGEFAAMLPVQVVLSSSGALISLVGALLIQPPRFTLLGHEELKTEDPEEAGFPADASRPMTAPPAWTADCE